MYPLSHFILIIKKIKLFNIIRIIFTSSIHLIQSHLFSSFIPFLFSSVPTVIALDELLIADSFVMVLLTIPSLMAQDILSNEPFTREWNTIDSLYRQGLPESAGKALDILKDNLTDMDSDDPLRQAHEIKALLYQLVLEAQLAVQGEWIAVQTLEELAAYADQPAKAIYQSYLAEKYFRYWQNNRWKIDQRTELADTSPTDDDLELSELCQSYHGFISFFAGSKDIGR